MSIINRFCDAKYLLGVLAIATFLSGYNPLVAREPSAVSQGAISRIAEMPNLPQPFHLRDWGQVTRDYIDFVFDFDKKGEHLPLMRWLDEGHTKFWMPAYVGSAGGPESINYLGALVSGSLVGIDMRTYRGQNWIDLADSFYSPLDGVFLDAQGGASGGSLWYDVLPNVLFFELDSLYPGDEKREQKMISIAGKWREGCIALGGRTEPGALPNFNHAGIDLRTMTPFDKITYPTRIEPEGAAGIAWMEYLTWLRTKDPRDLTAADWCLRALEDRPPKANPLYEVLLPYAPVVAARMNAEQGTHYNVATLLNWCFDPHPAPQARPGWGVITGRWNGLDVDGLVGSTTDGGGYAFTMNTFNYAGTLAPLARYDTRYAHDLGKWLLNVANAARLFYPNAHDAAHQSSSEWARTYDPKSVIAYEGLRKSKRGAATASADYRTVAGKIVAGSFASTRLYQEEPADAEAIQEAPSGDTMRLEHIWKIPLPAAAGRVLVVASRRVDGGHAGNSFIFSYASHPDGPFAPAFSVPEFSFTDPGGNKPKLAELPDDLHGTLYVKAESADHSPHPGGADQLRVDAIAVSYGSDIAPFAQGDIVVAWIDLIRGSTTPVVLYRPASVATDLGLYGSSYVGQLGGLVSTTNVEGILQWDLLKTDYFHAAAFPTHLYYNPHASPKTVEIEVGGQGRDIYDAASHAFVLRNATGRAQVTLPPDSARVLVITPPKGKVTREENRTLIDGIVVDFSKTQIHDHP